MIIAVLSERSSYFIQIEDISGGFSSEQTLRLMLSFHSGFQLFLNKQNSVGFCSFHHPYPPNFSIKFR